MPQGKAGKISCTNMHKSNLGSQLSIFYKGSFTRVPPHPIDPPEIDDTYSLKQPNQMILHGRPHNRNEGTRESQENKLHECAQSQPRVTT